MPLRLPRLFLRTIASVFLLLGWARTVSATAQTATSHTPGEYSLREWHEQDGLPSEEALPVSIGLGYGEFQKSWEQQLLASPGR